MVRVYLSSALAALALASAAATSVDFVNQCSFPVELYHSQEGSGASKVADIAVGATHTRDVAGPAHMFRHGASPAATLVEMACDGMGVWYDLSIIPPMTGHCHSFEACVAASTNGKGFNVPIAMNPKAGAGSGSCAALTCAGYDPQSCQDAYLYPADNIKTHNCPVNTAFEVVFCPGGAGASASANAGAAVASDDVASDYDGTVAPYDFEEPSVTTQAPTVATSAPAPSSAKPSSNAGQGGDATVSVKSTYAYQGKQAGNVPGSYDRVTSLNGCVKTPVTVNSPVGPLSEEVSMIFRGPMEISDIAVFTSEGSNATWSRVSSYNSESGHTDNLVFMNNLNIDYSGQNQHGPQGYSSADGKSHASEATAFGGYLAEASSPNMIGGGPGVQTGAEVNIMTSKKCDGDCLGYAGSNDHHGWGGGKKIFVTRVKMPQGSAPNQPAIWMLNAQVVHSNQYGCNCRGMGAVGGCGELDIAEVIETNAARDRVTTHYYFYDGSVLSPGGDNFAPRPFDDFTVYVTIIDDSGEGLVKIVEISAFDFSLETMGDALYRKLADA